MEFTNDFPEYLKYDQQIASETNVALFNASLTGNVKEVVKILKKGDANPNFFFNPADCKSSLMVACEIDNVEIVNLLLAAGAVPDALNLVTRYTPLHYAVVKDNVEVVRLLLNNGANINHQNAYGNSALHIAASEGSLRCLALLLESNANVTLVNNKLSTPLHFACYNDKIPLFVIKSLIEKGANIEAADHRGLTPLLVACVSGRDDIIAYLLSQGCDSNVVDVDGRSMKKILEFNGHYALKNRF